MTIAFSNILTATSLLQQLWICVLTLNDAKNYANKSYANKTYEVLQNQCSYLKQKLHIGQWNI